MIMRSTIKNAHLFVSVMFAGVTQQWHSQTPLQLFATSAMSSERLNNAFRCWCGTWPQRRCICLPMIIGFQRQKGPRGRRCVSWQLWWTTRRWWRERPTPSKSRPAISEVGSPESYRPSTIQRCAHLSMRMSFFDLVIVSVENKFYTIMIPNSSGNSIAFFINIKLLTCTILSCFIFKSTNKNVQWFFSIEHISIYF